MRGFDGLLEKLRLLLLWQERIMVRENSGKRGGKLSSAVHGRVPRVDTKGIIGYSGNYGNDTYITN